MPVIQERERGRVIKCEVTCSISVCSVLQAADNIFVARCGCF